jgi:ABC-type microcin C transport system duplicated ATPase subunit YejF
LKKYFKVKKGLLHAVDDITIKIPRGIQSEVVGESVAEKHARKSNLKTHRTYIRRCLFDGKSIIPTTNQKREMRRNMQIIFQDPYSSIDPRKTVAEIIADFMFIHKRIKTKKEIWNKTAELMDTVGLAQATGQRLSHELTREKTKNRIVARALSLNPQFIGCAMNLFQRWMFPSRLKY